MEAGITEILSKVAGTEARTAGILPKVIEVENKVDKELSKQSESLAKLYNMILITLLGSFAAIIIGIVGLLK